MERLSVLPSLILIFSIFLVSCSQKTQPGTGHGTDATIKPGGSMALPPCIVYKTRADYSTYVPVSLSEDKSHITSYPDVKDLRLQGNAVYPILLAGGYLLDNRGIGPNAAFLEITYEAYASQTTTPSADDLFQQLLDKDPLLEMYQCGNRHQYESLVDDLNQLIDSGKLSECKKLK